MRSLLVLLALLFSSCSAFGWMTAVPFEKRVSLTRRSMLSTPPPAVPADGSETEDPCWQDLYDDDCSMSSVYSASFVAGKWIKSMPCAQGLDEDCDMGDLDVPEIRQEGGVDHVDVMSFLGLKKAADLSTTKKGDDEDKAAP